MRDLKDNIDVVQSLTPAARTTSANGSSANLQGYEAAMAIVSFGVVTDGTHTPKLQESADNSTFTDVAAADLQGVFTAATSSAGGSASQRVGYKGALEYTRVVITVTGSPSTGALASAEIVRGYPAQRPLA